MQPNTRRFKKLMKRERALMLKGKGAFAEAQAQLDEEAAEDFYKKFKGKKKRSRRPPTPKHKRWARDNAEVLYNRRAKRKEKGY